MPHYSRNCSSKMACAIFQVFFFALILVFLEISTAWCEPEEIGNFTRIGKGFSYVATSLNYTWGISTDGDLFKCKRPCHFNWYQVQGPKNTPKMLQVDAGDEEVWVLGIEKELYRMFVNGSGGWTRVPTLQSVGDFSASGFGYVYVVDATGGKARSCRKPCQDYWSTLFPPFRDNTAIIDGGNNQVFGLSLNGSIYHKEVRGKYYPTPITVNGHHQFRQLTLNNNDMAFLLAASNPNDILMCHQSDNCTNVNTVKYNSEATLQQCHSTLDSIVCVDSLNVVLHYFLV